MSWVATWVDATFVGYDWHKPAPLYTYVCVLFKGLTLLTNVGYADPVRSSLSAVLWRSVDCYFDTSCLTSYQAQRHC